MKTSKRIISLVLCAVMVASTFLCLGPVVSFKAEAAVTLGGITQQRVVGTDGSYESIYRSYQKRFFKGEETNWPTNFVIPGLGSADNYTPQGMTYWKAKEWILISAYDADGSDPSVIYALDVVTTNLVAVFKIQNADGSYNKSHGGGIAASEYNFYYADSDSKVSYIPLSEMDVAEGTTKIIKLKDSVDFSREMTGSETNQTVKTSYCCYDDGVLWTGNFQWDDGKADTTDDSAYNNVYHAVYKSILMGYKLAGNSSAEEWYYLKNGYNLARITNGSTETEHTASRTSTDGNYSATMKYKKIEIDGANLEVRGSVTSNATAATEGVKETRVGEVTTPSDIGSFDLVEGKKYKISFISTNRNSDIYMWSPGGKHCNVKQSQSSTIRQLDDGRWYYEMIFTAGVKPTGADSGWQAAGVDDGTNYTGTYTFRIDQDDVITSNYDFAVTDISVVEYVDSNSFSPDPAYEGIGCAGNPTYVIAMDTDRVQYAMVDKGKLYVSRSWSRKDSGNHTRELMIADIDLNRPGDVTYTVNGRTHNIFIINYSDSTVTHFGGNYKAADNGVSLEERNQMLFMGEALCVINDYLYMFAESAAYTYNGKDSSNVCPEPIDVLWKIDQYAIQGLTRTYEDVAAVEYEKVTSLSDINSTDEYIILHESSIKDPVTQDNILYLLDSYGGYDDKKLPKKASIDVISSASTGDSLGVVGYEIRDYDVKTADGKTSIIISAEDDANKSLHWQFESGSSTSLKLRNRDLYYTNHSYFYSGERLFAMTTAADSGMTIEDKGNGIFCIKGGQWYNLWCNDGSVSESITKYTNYYRNHGVSGYTPNYHGLAEVPGTFHVNLRGNPAMATDEQTYFHIYRRVADPYASTYETQVYTDMKAKLQADGTYNITVETYATNSIQYQYVREKRPIDYIFVIDSSGLMDTSDSAGYTRYGETNTLSPYSVAGDSTSVGDTDAVTGKTGSIYHLAEDGEYYQLYVDASARGDDGNWLSHKYYKYYWLYYKKDGVNVYYNPSTNGWQTTKPSESEVGKKYGNSDEDRAKVTIYTGVHYKLTTIPRLDAVKNAIDSLTYKIAADANSSGLAHRIALVKFGSDSVSEENIPAWTNTGMYTNDGVFHQSSGYDSISETYLQNAFFNVSQFGTVRNLVNSMTYLGHNFPSYGLDMASDIIDNSDSTYDVNGDRSAVVIVISSGAPGYITESKRDENKSYETANVALGAEGAYSLKRNGAHVYTALFGNGTTSAGFDLISDADFEKDFMRYLSSDYPGAKAMDDPGALNTREGADYYLEFTSGSTFNLDKITDGVLTQVNANSDIAISSLTAESILRERLTDAFDLTNATVTCQFAKSKYDGIGRMSFEAATAAPSSVKATLDKANYNLEVTGFDYSENNVSEYNSNKGLGNKLIVTISGVTANPNKTLTSAAINDKDYTALYETETHKNENKALKNFQQYHFAIPEYTYVLDYDLPMLDTDINGTLISADIEPRKQDVNNYETDLQTKVFGVKFSEDKQNMYYSLNSQEGSAEDNSRAYILIQRDDKSYDWFRLNLIPASTVYYEDNKTATLSGTEKYGDWTPRGDYTNKYQTLSSSSDVYGNDPTYGNSTEKFSLGTYLETTVSSSNNRSETKTFTFKGTGFDLYSACGNNTGIQTVTVKDSAGKLVKAYIVDTYYNDAKYGTIYQAPIVHFEGAHGEYTVETTAAYYSFAGALKTQSTDTLEIEGTDIEASTAIADVASTDELFRQIGMDELIGQEVEVIWMDENSIFNGGTGAGNMDITLQGDLGTTTTEKTLVNYIDGFRIYNPLNTDDKDYPINEQGAQYYNLIGNLGSGVMTGSSLFGYIEGNEGSFGFADYSSITGNGPKHEVYLTSNSNNGVSFKMQVNNDNVSAKLSMRAVAGNPKVTVNGQELTVSSTSEQYYDISGAIKGQDTVTIKVSSTGTNDLVAIGNLRLNNASLVSLSNEDLPNVARLMTMSAEPIDYDPTQTYVAPPTFVDAPADNPFIDPEGSIPDIDEICGTDGSTEEPVKNFFDIVVDFFKTIIERIKEVLQALPVFWTKAK